MGGGAVIVSFHRHTYPVQQALYLISFFSFVANTNACCTLFFQTLTLAHSFFTILMQVKDPDSETMMTCRPVLRHCTCSQFLRGTFPFRRTDEEGMVWIYFVRMVWCAWGRGTDRYTCRSIRQSQKTKKNKMALVEVCGD